MRSSAIIFFFLILFPVMTVQVMAGNQFSVPEQRVLYRAQQAMDKQDYAAVREQLSSYLQRHPDTQQALFFLILGNACYQQEDLEAAATWYQAGWDKNPDDLSLCRNLAAARYGLEQFAKAGKLFERAYQLSEPREYQLLYQAGIAFYQAQQLSQSRRVLKKLLATAPTHRKEWLTLMIQVCYAQQDLTHTTRLLTSFLETYPWERSYWKLLAGICTEQEKYAQATAALRTALSLGNATAQEWNELSSLYFYLNAPLQGVKCLEKARELSPDASHDDALAKGYLRAHRFSRALHYLDLAIARKATPERLMTKARALMTARRFHDAINTLQQLEGMESDAHDEALLLMGYCAMENQNWHQAATWLSRVKDDRFASHAASALQSIAPLLETPAD
jgi:tetratricopeptide (TPR) repeat protein